MRKPRRMHSSSCIDHACEGLWTTGIGRHRSIGVIAMWLVYVEHSSECVHMCHTTWQAAWSLGSNRVWLATVRMGSCMHFMHIVGQLFLRPLTVQSTWGGVA